MKKRKLSSKAHGQGGNKRTKTGPLTFTDLPREIRQQVLSSAAARTPYDRTGPGSYNEPEALHDFVLGLKDCMPTIEALSNVAIALKDKALKADIKRQLKMTLSDITADCQEIIRRSSQCMAQFEDNMMALEESLTKHGCIKIQDLVRACRSDSDRAVISDLTGLGQNDFSDFDTLSDLDDFSDELGDVFNDSEMSSEYMSEDDEDDEDGGLDDEDEQDAAGEIKQE